MILKRLFVIGLFLSLSALGVCQGLVLQVGEASQILVEKSVEAMRERGIVRTHADIELAKVIENHREALSQRARDLAAYQNAYRQTGNSSRVQQIQNDINVVKDMYKRLPIATAEKNYTKEMNQYLKTMGKVVYGRVQKLDGEVSTFKKEVKPIYRSGGERPTGETGENIRGGQIGDNLEIYVQSLSGDAQFYLNGVKVTGVRQAIPIQGEGSLLVVVKGLGKTRKMVQDFVGGANTSVDEKSDDVLTYTVTSGSFHGKTTWKVKDETVNFAVTKVPNLHATVNELRNRLKITFDGTFSIGLSASGTTTWRRRSQRPAKTVEDEVKDDFKGNIVIWIGGKG